MPKVPVNYNKICQKCRHKCKQKDTVLLLSCPRFEAKIVQMEIKVPGLRRVDRKRS